MNREHPFQCPFNLRRFFRIKCIEYFLLSEVDVLVYDRLQFGDFSCIYLADTDICMRSIENKETEHLHVLAL